MNVLSLLQSLCRAASPTSERATLLSKIEGQNSAVLRSNVLTQRYPKMLEHVQSMVSSSNIVSLQIARYQTPARSKRWDPVVPHFCCDEVA